MYGNHIIHRIVMYSIVIVYIWYSNVSAFMAFMCGSVLYINVYLRNQSVYPAMSHQCLGICLPFGPKLF